MEPKLVRWVIDSGLVLIASSALIAWGVAQAERTHLKKEVERLSDVKTEQAVIKQDVKHILEAIKDINKKLDVRQTYQSNPYNRNYNRGWNR